MSNKYNLLLDAARLMHSLADVLAAIAETYADVKLVEDAEVIEAAEPPKELPENKYYIFGKDGGKELAEELNIPLLGQVPLVQSIREGGDEGMPIAMQDGHPAAQMFAAICNTLLEQ